MARRVFAVVGLKSTMMMDTENPLQFAKPVGIRCPLAAATKDLNEYAVVYSQANPCRSAMTAACVRSVTPSFARIELT